MTQARSDSVLLDKVYQIVYEKFDAAQGAIANEFLKGLFNGLSGSDLHQRSDSDLYGVGISLWNALNKTALGVSHIRVYNPELERHGWQSPHTIVEIIVDDKPFLVDSIRMALNRLGINAHLLLHHPMSVVRGSGKVLAIQSISDSLVCHQTAFIIEIDRQSDAQAMRILTQEFADVVAEIGVIVADWQFMLVKLTEVTKKLNDSAKVLDPQSLQESLEFLSWLGHHNFTLMGYGYYTLDAIKGDYILNPHEEGRLGLFRSGLGSRSVALSSMPAKARLLALGKQPLLLNKSNYTSRVHRPAYIDHIGIKAFNKAGNVVGEHRFIGLYASGIYNHSAMQIPMLQAKVGRIMESSGFSRGSHAYKALLNIIETYPRDELIQATEDELLQAGIGILHIQERDVVRLFVRPDTYGRYYSCIIYTPKERYNTALRIASQSILKSYFNACDDVEFTTYFTEGVMARTHYLVRVPCLKDDLNVSDLELNLIEAARSWDDKLVDSLIGNYGEEEAKRLARKYQHAFPRSYKEALMPGSAVADLWQLEQLTDTNRLGMLFYRPQEEQASSQVVKLKLFHLRDPLHLSDILPMLENMGLRVIDESPHAVKTADGHRYWILDFSMTYDGQGALDIEGLRDNFQNALGNIWQGQLESDGFNQLVLKAQLSGRQVVILRAYAKYQRQLGSTFSQSYIINTLSRYPGIAKVLLELFHRRFSPSMKRSSRSEQKLIDQIHLGLDAVENLDDDRIIRRFLELILATVRTNFYQNRGEHQHISFKFLAAKISDMPAPKPMFEIFVYSPRVEGVHLRGGKVARGGLRWSDRREDFRTEILGLVKAQQVKNTVIVPVGAKGGFVCKRLPVDSERAALIEEGKACYGIFIRGLLDITDNVIEGKIVPPIDVVRHDEDDPYLVVAADKGTATFSDIANAISAEYQFWMHDAFASGGSNGYDHKKMGITARGAWESVKRHFREMGIDCQKQAFRCVGIGDMAGDVFGNGMLLSEQTLLIAAFNHQHIFIDPQPDAKASYHERQRLFEQLGSSWSDYDSSLISEGGALISRRAKSVTLTPQMQQALDTEAKVLNPNELIRIILKAPVDLIWNGGIGTYVKASSESDADVGDRTNNPLRVCGNELRARIIGEGGNLGCTQLGRIEFARGGGRVNTDFIDNVGGVDCSDNEVNIKILLNQQVAAGELTHKHRNKLLVDMTDDVADIVLANAYRQSQSLSVEQAQSYRFAKDSLRFIHALERQGLLDRPLEFLPSDDEITERLSNSEGLTRPELAVLLAYAKMTLKQELNTAEITDDPFLSRELNQAFPTQIQTHFEHQIIDHPLRPEIIATRLANQVVDDMGFNFVARLADETGASSSEICTCYMICREVFGFEKLYRDIEQLDNQIEADIQINMMTEMQRIGRRATRRFLRQRDRSLTTLEQIARYQSIYLELKPSLSEILEPEEVAEIQTRVDDWTLKGVPVDIASNVAQLSSLYASLDIAEICEQSTCSAFDVSDLYFSLGARIDLHWFLAQINAQPVENHWQGLARASFREELDWQQRMLVQSALAWITQRELSIHAGLEAWLEAHALLLARWQHMLADFRATTGHELAKFPVLLRELNLLNLNCVKFG
jgi:glutamate dehydrogenase